MRYLYITDMHLKLTHNAYGQSILDYAMSIAEYCTNIIILW